jgi:nucleoside-diphosphate-sugar epimerase
MRRASSTTISNGMRVNASNRVRLQQGDIADPALVRPAVLEVDGKFHLAGIASVERSREDWLGTNATNLARTIVQRRRAFCWSSTRRLQRLRRCGR